MRAGEGARGGTPFFGVVVIGGLAATLFDLALLQGKYHLFTGGFLRPDRVEGLAVPLFLALSVLLDTAAVALFAPLALRVVGFVRRRGPRVLTAALVATLPVVTCGAARLGLDRFVGDWLGYHLAGGGGLPLGARAVGTLALAGLALVGGGLLYLGAHFMPDRSLRFLGRDVLPRGRVVLLGGAGVVGAVLAVAACGALWPHGQRLLLLKTSARWAADLGAWATDLDGDGTGLVVAPFDGAPLDAARHPWAVDLPGNGIDENGIGGDLAEPGDFGAEDYPPLDFARRPDFVLFVLESYRADNLDAEEDGQPVAPVLRGLRAGGAVHGPAYSHNGFTVPSLNALFSGSLVGARGTLIDDFEENGYFTACVSGEDESFGEIARTTGMLRADYFVDARRDPGQRCGPSTAPGSLTVPWTVVAGRVENLLDTLGPEGPPLFLYVNFQDCHYPYAHHAMEPILADAEGDGQAALRRRYRNAAANVDRAVGRVLARIRAVRGKAPAFVVVGDHGEMLGEHGRLGHGTALTREGGRIPFLAGGFAARCTFPVGLADVRRLVREGLARDGDRPEGRVDPARWVFQHVGPLEAPRVVGAAFAAGGRFRVLYEDAGGAWGDPVPVPRPDPVTVWEQIVFARAMR